MKNVKVKKRCHFIHFSMCADKNLKNPRNPLLIPLKLDHEQHPMCRSRVNSKMTINNE